MLSSVSEMDSAGNDAGSVAHNGKPSRNAESSPDATQRPVMATTLEQPTSVDERSDEDLLSAYRQGDRQSFAKLVERYQRELFHFLIRFLGDRAAAEDVFQ